MKFGIKSLILFFCLTICQSAFCYVLAPVELNKTIEKKVSYELAPQIKKYSNDFNIAIIGTPSEKIITNETQAPKIEVINPSSSFLANSYRKVIVKNSKNQVLKTFGVSVRVKIFKEVLIATNNIPFNQEINSSNSALERVDITRNLTNYSTKTLNGTIAKRNIIKGSIISSDYIKEKSAVFKNSLVDIKFQSSKGLEIKLQGIALKEGAIGDTILVKSDKYNKVYNAKVKSSNEVVVRI